MFEQIKLKLSVLTIVLLLICNHFAVYGKPNWPKPIFDDREWVLGYSKNTHEVRFEEYILKNESINNWSEMVTAQFIPGDIDLKEYASAWSKEMESTGQCEVYSYIIDDMDDGNKALIFYGSYQHEEDGIVLIVPESGVGIHTFIYAVHDQHISKQEAQKWLINLESIIPHN